MTKTLQKEIEKIMKSQNIDCHIDKFVNKANWYSLSLCQPLSTEFIEEYIDNINWFSFFLNKQISDETKQLFACNA